MRMRDCLLVKKARSSAARRDDNSETRSPHARSDQEERVRISTCAFSTLANLKIEYIGQLEGEIAAKVNENSDLRSQNRALMEENTRLSDLTRMLLSSPSFSGFLDTLASNPQAAQTAQAVQQQQPQQQPQRQMRKDVNPYAGQQSQQQQIGMAMMPEHNTDFSMLDLNSDGAFSYQPQVFSVLSMPETVIDTEVLSGKNSSFTSLASEDEKVELPQVERMPASNPEKEISAPVVPVVDEEFDADPAFSLFTTAAESTATESDAEQPAKDLDISNIIMNITLKPSEYELVIKSEVDDATADAAMKRIERLCDNMEAVADRLSSLTLHL